VQEEEKKEKLKTIVEAIMSSNNPLNHYHTCFPSILINKSNARDKKLETFRILILITSCYVQMSKISTGLPEQQTTCKNLGHVFYLLM